MPSPSPSSEQFEPSCDQAVQLAGQFLGLASAGVAFVVGLVYSTDQHLPSGVVIAACLLFGSSVILGLVMRMGVVSDLHKTGTCDIYSMRLRLVAALQIVLFLLGAGVVAAATFNHTTARTAQVSPPAEWTVTGKGMTAGLSGLALVDHDSGRTVLLAVHDNKAESEPRLSLLTRREGARGIQAQSIDWPGAQPVELEAICRVPGKPSEFIAVTSKGYLYHLALDRQRTSVAILHQTRLPGANDSSEIESFDARSFDGKIIACWAQRGNKDQPAVVSCAGFDPQTLKFKPAAEACFTSPWPEHAARHISDLRLTETGAVLVTSTSAPGDNGPFASALYVAGRIDTTAGKIAFVPESSATRLWSTSKHKVEGLELIPGPTGGLVFGADDEARGGAIEFNDAAAK